MNRGDIERYLQMLGQELIRHLKLAEPQEVIAILNQYIPQKYLNVSMQYMVDDWFD